MVGWIFLVMLCGFVKYVECEVVVIYFSDEIEVVLWVVNLLKNVCLLKLVEGEVVVVLVVLMSLGMMLMYCVLVGILGVVVYWVNLLMYVMGCWFVKVLYFGIVNLLLKELMYLEYI